MILSEKEVFAPAETSFSFNQKQTSKIERKKEKKMRIIQGKEIIQKVRDMCIEANYELTSDMCERLKQAQGSEESPLGREILNQLQENLKIAREEKIPICQDTGMAVVFVDIGQEIQVEGGYLGDLINEGVRRGYQEGYLRKSVVRDPIQERVNTGDNTPAVIHYNIIPGDQMKITVAPKGFGSENMSRIFMLKPAEGYEGAKKAVLKAVEEAGPNACPPMVIGVGIGGTFEKCACLAKRALIRPLTERAKIPYLKKMEEELLQEINKTGIGPGGLGGRITALAVNIESYPTHIAGMPVAVNICCHVNRHAVRIL